MPPGDAARRPFPRPSPAVELRFGAPTSALTELVAGAITPIPRFLPWSLCPLGARMRSGSTDVARVCLTRLRYVFRFSQPPDVFLPASPYPGYFTGLAPSGLPSSKVFILVPGKDTSRHPLPLLAVGSPFLTMQLEHTVRLA